MIDFNLSGLYFRALKFDSCETRRDAFVKRSLQITALHGPAFIAALLTLISELMRVKPVFGQRILHTPIKNSEEQKLTMFEDDSDGEERFYDVDENNDVKKRCVADFLNCFVGLLFCLLLI